MTEMTSEAGDRPQGAFVARLTRWIGIASVVLTAIISAAQILEFVTLPDCDSERASKSLLDVARAAQIEADGVRDPQGLPSGSGEISCKANLALTAGATIAVRYRFFWEGWTQNVEIIGVEG